MLSARRLVVALTVAIMVAFGAGSVAAQDGPHPRNAEGMRTNPNPTTAPTVSVVGGNSGSSASATPEPTTMLLMGAGLAGLYSMRRRR